MTTAPALPDDSGGEDTVLRLRRTLLEQLRQAIGPAPRVALVDFPNHPNVGDTAIYLGELAALRELGCEVAYVATAASYHPAILRRRLGRGGVVLVHGGGNFGDIWASFQAFRERVVADQHERRVVVMPQTVHYRDEANAAGTAAVFAAHPDLHLLLRDHASLAFARHHFGTATTGLCPDSAFALGPWAAPAPQTDLVLFARTDQEATHDWPPLPPGTVRTDWPEPSRRLRVLRDASRALAFPLKRAGAAAAPLDEPLRRLYTWLSHERMREGLDVLASGRMTITDRLHAHILSILMGRPHVLLDNSYGKNRAFYDAWTSASPLVRWADDGAQALALAAPENVLRRSQR